MDKRDPIDDIFPLRDRINKIFDGAHETALNESSVVWIPVADIYETPQMFVVKVDLPEVSESDISVNVYGHQLKISGERKLQREGRHYHQVERCCGRYSRCFTMPEVVDKDNIQASLKDGILKIILPKRAQEAAAHIEIK